MALLRALWKEIGTTQIGPHILVFSTYGLYQLFNYLMSYRNAHYHCRHINQHRFHVADHTRVIKAYVLSQSVGIKSSQVLNIFRSVNS